MDKRVVIASLLGSGAVYSLMAACSGAIQPSAQAESAAPDGPTSTNQPVQVLVRPCDKKVNEDGGSALSYAEAEYPGKSRYEIAARVRAWRPILYPSTFRPSGWDLEPEGVMYVKDGYAGAPCGTGVTEISFVYAP